jgi:hypothetical protein
MQEQRLPEAIGYEGGQDAGDEETEQEVRSGSISFFSLFRSRSLSLHAGIRCITTRARRPTKRITTITTMVIMAREFREKTRCENHRQFAVLAPSF